MHLNCDVGEGEPAGRGRALMRWVDAANVACGGHAGNVATMERYVCWCRQQGVLLGAHPGTWSRSDFGRGPARLRGGDLELLLVQQVGALERVAAHWQVRLHHLKLHGALYHATEAESALARVYVNAARKWWPRLRLIVRAGGRVAAMARRAGVRVWEEAFADRAYRLDGSLVPRELEGAVLRPSLALVQASTLLEQGAVRTVEGRLLTLRAQTLCVHGDTVGAVGLLRRISASRGEEKSPR